MDAEPGYEDIPHTLQSLDDGYLDDFDSRKTLYWALFAGAHGHTYGCHPIWQMWRVGHDSLMWTRRPWYEALHLPGAAQMGHARALLLSRPFLERVPDQSLLLSEAGAGVHHVRATRDEQGRYAMVYIPTGRPVELDLAKLSGERLRASWFDPRTGMARVIGVFPKAERRAWTPPFGGPDWVLVLDDVDAGFGEPRR
jgi:hypothetical protein